MIIIDKGPVSTEMWYWFNEKATNKVPRLPETLPMSVFKFLIKPDDRRRKRDDDDENERKDWPLEYDKLTFGQFWAIYTDVFMICTGIFTEGMVSPKFTLKEIQKEITTIIDVASRWAVMEGFTKFHFGDYDYAEIDSDKGRLRQGTRYKIYYMALVIQEAVDELEKLLRGKEIRDIKMIDKYNSHANNQAEIMEEIIRDKSKGDLDEFVLYTIQALQFNTMGPHHNKMAQLVRFTAFGEKEFDKLLPPCEIWRLLFANYFDGVEDYFNRFYNKFTSECIAYFTVDYLATDYGIKKIPIYKLFTNDDCEKSCTAEIKFLIDTDKVKRDIEEVDRQYRLS